LEYDQPLQIRIYLDLIDGKRPVKNTIEDKIKQIKKDPHSVEHKQ